MLFTVDPVIIDLCIHEMYSAKGNKTIFNKENRLTTLYTMQKVMPSLTLNLRYKLKLRIALHLLVGVIRNN